MTTYLDSRLFSALFAFAASPAGTNAAARLFEVYQSGCLVVQKLKTGGTQRVVVQDQ
jgi:hypothetical protein